MLTAKTPIRRTSFSPAWKNTVFVHTVYVVANNERHEEVESVLIVSEAVNYFFYLVKCYWVIVPMVICWRTLVEMKMASTSDIAFYEKGFHFFPVVLERKEGD